MDPITFLLLAGGGFYLYEKKKNPAWTPFKWLFSTPTDKVLALEKVKITSVPTPAATVALDPNMSTDQVKQVNATLTTEVDPIQIASHSVALDILGHVNSAKALAAKANAVGEAKAMGATDVDLHQKQVEAASATPSTSPVTSGAYMTGYGYGVSGFEGSGDGGMPTAEAQVILNDLIMGQGHYDVNGIYLPIPITNLLDADTVALLRIFQRESGLPATGTTDVATVAALRGYAVSTPPPSTMTGWDPHDRYGDFNQHHRMQHEGYAQQQWGHEPMQPWQQEDHLGRGHHHHPGMQQQYGMQEQPFQMQQMPEMPPLSHHPRGHRHHHHHHRHPGQQGMPQQGLQGMQQGVQPQQGGGGGGGGDPSQQPLQDPSQAQGSGDGGSDTSTQGWWHHHNPYNVYDPYGQGFGGYGMNGYGGPGGLGGYGSWGSYGGWGHGL